jgi:hypothetical protein
MKNPILGRIRNRRTCGNRRQDGATMIEFAIVSPFAILLVLGIIQIALLLSAKSVVNEAAFLAARAGAVQGADPDAMNAVMTKALIPFYRDTTQSPSFTNMYQAYLNSFADTRCIAALQCFLDLEVLNPTAAAFQDFGIPGANNQLSIPNDNLAYRSRAVQPDSGLSIQDANVLKIKVTYGYQIKVPLMQWVVRSVMCGFDTGVDAFGRGSQAAADAGDCFNFYDKGRIPIVAYATVQMQTPASNGG